MRAHLCGFVSGDGRVVRYEVSCAQFGCGSEHNESDWGVFVCGRLFLYILRMYMYSMCVCKTHNSFSLPVSYGDKGGYSGYSPDDSRRCPKAPRAAQNHTPTLYTHTELTQRRHRRSLVWLRLLPDKLRELCEFFFHCVSQGVSQWEVICTKK